MKNDKKASTMKQMRAPQLGRLSLLVGALVATGVLSPLSLPEAMAAPLPAPCAGCGTTGQIGFQLQQPGMSQQDMVTLTNIDPITGLPNPHHLTINQPTQTAILNWQEFNIDKGYSVNFAQPNSEASTLNRIWSPTGVPSIIAGSLTANGQVYLINRNGIIFANGAQVKADHLIASSLDIEDELYEAGYLTSVLDGVNPAFSGSGGFVKVETGAVLNGSRIMMFAPVVENKGTISTPNGQTVLAAGNRIYLAASQDPNLRGVLVEVDVDNAGQIDSALAGEGLEYTERGVATNSGDIIAQRGNITVVGFAVNQEGRVSATTSVTENGSIKLLARYGVHTNNLFDVTNPAVKEPARPLYYDIRATQTGKVTLGKGSVTTVMPETDDTATTTVEQGFNPSIVEVMGKTINMQSGSSIIVPGGKVTLAAINILNPKTGPNNAYQLTGGGSGTSFLNSAYIPEPSANDQARVFLDSGSLIDVSGSSTSMSVARNIITVQLRGSQLANSPVQRVDGTLWGEDVLVDIRKGTTLADYSAEEAQIGRTAAELTATGGTVALLSTGDVVMKSGATIDLSGGQIEYTGANIKSTSLISNGVLYDIANAAPDQLYQGLGDTYKVTYAKWGVTESYTSMAGGDLRGNWDPGYTEGKSAGTLTVLAPRAVLDGDIAANTVAGTYQRQPYADSATAGTAYADTWQMMAKGGTLVIGHDGAVANESGIVNYVTDSDVTIQNGTTPLAADFTLFDPLAGTTNALPAEFQAGIVLDARKFGSSTGVNNLVVKSNKTVSVASGTTLRLTAGGEVTLQGDTVNMLGAIDAPAGSVNLGTAVSTASTNLTAGKLNVGAADGGSYISTRGQWVNDSPLLGVVPDWSKSLTINGGNISLVSGGDLLVESGTVLDASGGAWLDSSNKTHGGNGGAIELASGETTLAQPFKAQLGGVDLRSYGTAGGKGGSLSIAAGDIVLGGSSVSNDTTLVLPETFFQNGGFTKFSLNAQGGSLKVVEGTVIEPIAESLILDSTAAMQVSGSDVTTFATVGVVPEWMRAPTSITLKQSNKNGGTLTVGAGAVIRVEPTANITLSATKQLTMLGTLDAAAGSIELKLGSLDNYEGTQSIWLGSESKLLSHGYFQQAKPSTQNLVQGKVLAGGKISITAGTGYVVAQKGSLMDVAGAAADIDLPQRVEGNLVYRSSHVAGDAGSITVQTSEGAFFDGSMSAGVEAGSKASGGSFSLTLNNSYGVNNIGFDTKGFPLNPAQIQVLANGNGGFAAQAVMTPGDDANAGKVALDAFAGKALLDVNALQQSGFDRVTLKSDNTILLGGVDWHARRNITLDAPQLVVNGINMVTAPQLTLGNLDIALQELLNPLDKLPLTPAAGDGVLNVTAQMVDLTGNFLVSGADQLNISSDDIRMNGVGVSELTGSLTTQGDIVLTANQVYPSTLAQYEISVKDDAGAVAGSIKIQRPDGEVPSLSPLLSAAGKLTLNADKIEQDGVLKAPLGTIELNGKTAVTLYKGSVISVSAEGATIPFGLIESGNTWKYDLTGGNDLITITDPAPKRVKLTAPDVVVEDGAKVDLSGGGDLYATEFFAGSGGKVNVLDPAKAPANTYAIIPGISGYAPYDPQAAGKYADSTSQTKLQAGASVYLEGGNGLKAGYYTLLPASYALLPGAYRVTAVAGYTDRQPGQGITTLVDGSQIMAGKFAVVGTDIEDARYSGFMVTPGEVVRTQSEYHDSYANTFFAEQAASSGTLVPRTPVDAGQLILDATHSLVLAGTLDTQAGTGGKGAWIDLNGPGFDIVNTAGTGATGLLELTTDMLNQLGAESLLIGGIRTATTDGTSIAVGADTVLVDNSGATLSGAEIILAANTAVTVKAGSNIEGKGTFSGQASNISISNANADGALLRVSSAEQVTVARKTLTGAAATLTIEDGATVGAENAVLLDSSSASVVGSSAVLQGKNLSIAAQNIDIGTNPSASGTSLALSGALLAQSLTFKDLTLHSYQDINFYGDAALGGLDANQQHQIDNLVLNSRSINGVGNAGATNVIDAANVTLINNNSGTSASGYGGGDLTINADQITLGAGDKAIRGFNTVTFAASTQIVAQDTGSVTVVSGEAVPTVHNLVLQAGQITGTNKSNLTITAANDVISILSPTGAAAQTTESLNAKLKIEGKSIVDNGVINLESGFVTLHATGADAADGVTLGAGSVTNVSGMSKVINSGQTAYAQAGAVSLIAKNGGVDIQNGALVDVSGAGSVSDTDGGSDAGSINIAATKGAVTVAGKLKATTANAKYEQGSFTLDAKSLAGTTTNALTELNDTLTSGGTYNPDGSLKTAGFSTLRDIRVRTGDLEIEADVAGATMARAKAQTFHLTADTGMIDVYGKVDASGVKGGDILLAAGAKDNPTLHTGALTLHTGALLDAHASGAGERGGKVTLETTETRSASGDQTAAGTIDLGNQLIDVHGDGNTGGTVHLRAPRIANAAAVANSEVALNNTGGTTLNVSNGANVTVEAFKTYTSAGTLGATDVAATSSYNTEAKNFAANAAAIKARLGMGTLDPNTGLLTSVVQNQHLTPGVQIDSATNLTLSKDWDLSTWRFNDGTGANAEAGILTLRAVGNMQFGTVVGTIITQASLTDGIPYAPTNNIFGIKATGGPADSPKGAYIDPMTGPSWSYRLVSGADTSSADVMAVKNDLTGNFTLVAGKETPGSVTTYYMEQIRTGTGFIDIAAGGNFNLGNKYSVIYTFGQPMTGVPVTGANANNKYFGVDGGDISILAKGDVNGAPTDQLVTDWQWREGLPNADGTINKQPAWWINLQSFRQNVGALGGGNVSVKAGGNINTLSAVAPSTGYVDMVDPTHPTVVLGGGNLSVTAGGDINSGVFYVGNGQGSVRAGGSLGSNRKDTNRNLYTVLALGQGNFDVRAGGDLNLETILNPTVIAQGPSQMPSALTAKTYFFTYGNTSGVSLTSLSGDVNLQNTIESNLFYQTTKAHTYAGLAANGYTEVGGTGFFRIALGQNVAGLATVYPGSLIVNAPGGSINSKNSATLFASVTGDLQLIAAKDIQVGLTMSDAAVGGLQANTVTTATSNTLPTFTTLRQTLWNGHSSLHALDDQPVIVSAGGNIGGSLTLPKAAQIEAGQDVLNLSLVGQNLKSTDTTSIVAGRDIAYSSLGSITMAGPGQIVLQAGRNVDLGSGEGVVTKGNLTNPLLPEQGASITVLAGVGQGADTQSFIDKYIDPASPKSYGADLVKYVADNWSDLVRHGNASGTEAPQSMTGAQAYAYFGKLSQPLQEAFAGHTYDQALISFVSKYGGSMDMTADQAYSSFVTMSKPLQNAFLQQVFFSELKDSGRYAVTSKNYQTGFDAISTLFPTTSDYKGDINLYYSQIKTMRGGDINLFAPGGNVNAGLANPSANTDKKPESRLGIVTVKGGDVNAFVNNDFMVNQSRVFTLQGGNIMLWSSHGDIDAGKGSKSVSSTPAPLLVVDLNTGRFNIDTTRSIVGSGIAVLLANQDVVPGSVDLIAPNGTVNAGDAGIRSAGDIFIAANLVLGADNISFGGDSGGVPVAPPAAVSADFNLQDASQVADQATQSIANMGDMSGNDFKPTFLSVEVIGLGDGGGL